VKQIVINCLAAYGAFCLLLCAGIFALCAFSKPKDDELNDE